MLLKYRIFNPLLILDVFINCQQKHDCKENFITAPEVRDIVSVSHVVKRWWEQYVKLAWTHEVGTH